MRERKKKKRGRSKRLWIALSHFPRVGSLGAWRVCMECSRAEKEGERSFHSAGRFNSQSSDLGLMRLPVWSGGRVLLATARQPASQALLSPLLSLLSTPPLNSKQDVNSSIHRRSRPGRSHSTNKNNNTNTNTNPSTEYEKKVRRTYFVQAQSASHVRLVQGKKGKRSAPTFRRR